MLMFLTRLKLTKYYINHWGTKKQINIKTST